MILFKFPTWKIQETNWDSTSPPVILQTQHKHLDKTYRHLNYRTLCTCVHSILLTTPTGCLLSTWTRSWLVKSPVNWAHGFPFHHFNNSSYENCRLSQNSLCMKIQAPPSSHNKTLKKIYIYCKYTIILCRSPHQDKTLNFRQNIRLWSSFISGHEHLFLDLFLNRYGLTEQEPFLGFFWTMETESRKLRIVTAAIGMF